MGWNFDTIHIIQSQEITEKATKALYSVMVDEGRKQVFDLSWLRFQALEWMCEFGHTEALKLAFEEIKGLREQQQQQQQLQEGHQDNVIDSTTFYVDFSLEKIPESELLRIELRTVDLKQRSGCLTTAIRRIPKLLAPLSVWGCGLDLVLASAIRSYNVSIVEFVLSQRRQFKKEIMVKRQRERKTNIFSRNDAKGGKTAKFVASIAPISITMDIIDLMESNGYDFNPLPYVIKSSIDRDRADLTLFFIEKLRRKIWIRQTQTNQPLRRPSYGQLKLESLGHPSLVNRTETFGPKTIKALFGRRRVMSMYTTEELQELMRNSLDHARKTGWVAKVVALLDTKMVVLMGTDIERQTIGFQTFIRCAIVKPDISEWLLYESAKCPLDCFLK
ncbi:hypothetical protein HDU76_001960, partial [Blyttiomyces sp. JEL0837]